MKLPLSPKFLAILAVVVIVGSIGIYYALQANQQEPVTEITNDIPTETSIPLDNNFQAEKESSNTTQNSDTDWTTILLVSVIALIFGPGTFFFFYALVPIGLWWQARLSGIHIGWDRLMKMGWQKVPHDEIIKLMIKAKNAKINIHVDELKRLYLTGVPLAKIVEVLILANNAGLDLTVSKLGELEHAGVDIEKVVRNMISAHNAKIELDIDSLADSFLAQVDIEKVVDTLIKAKSAGIQVVDYDFLSQQFLANLDVALLIDTLQIAKEGGIQISRDQLVADYLEGAKIFDIVQAVIAAQSADKSLEDEAKLNLNYNIAKGISLSGIDIKQAVHDSINFKVLETKEIVGYAGDGVEVRMKARVTVRPRIQKIIKGAGEDTVLARVNEALVTEIGRVESHLDITVNPYEVADMVEKRQFLFDDTAFEIKSIDISDIKIGKSVHAELDMEIAKAKAEMARAKALAAEEDVQKAMADAFRSGNFSIEEYKKMKNIDSDTKMRDSFSNQNLLDNKLDEDDEEEDDEHEK